MVGVSRPVLLGCAFLLVSLVGAVAPPAAWPQCSTLPAPTALNTFPGSINFNNTVRAQMWVADNVWWGAFSDASSGIYFYKRMGQRFVKADLIDTNSLAGAPDTVWNGSELFVLVFQSGSLARLYKYSYRLVPEYQSATGTIVQRPTYVLLRGFPLSLALAGRATAIALHQDSTGKLWATYTSGLNVHVIWSTSVDHRTWDTTGVILAPDISDRTTEASTIMPFGGNKIGVVWGNQALGEFAFRFHLDGDPETTWSPKEIVDCCHGLAEGVADDHISLRAAPDGRLFLVAKDSIGNGRLHLYVRSPEGTWAQKILIDPDPAAQPTRPTLALDIDNAQASVMYHNSTDGLIYLYRVSMDSPARDGPCIFIGNRPGEAGRVNNVTSTKQNVNRATGLVAAGARSGQILSSMMDLASPAQPASLKTGEASGLLPASFTAGPDRPAAAGPEGAPVAGVDVVWDGRLSTSQEPGDDSRWRSLRAQGVSTVVNLDDTMFDVGQYGFESFLWVRMASGRPPTDEEAETFLKFIQQRDNQPAHIVSAASDRRATMVALVRYAIDGWAIQRALAEGQRLNGGAPLAREQVEWLLGWAGRHLPGSHRLNRQSTRDSTPAGATPTWASTPSVLASAEPGVILAGSHPSGR